MKRTLLTPAKLTTLLLLCAPDAPVLAAHSICICICCSCALAALRIAASPSNEVTSLLCVFSCADWMQLHALRRHLVPPVQQKQKRCGLLLLQRRLFRFLTRVSYSVPSKRVSAVFSAAFACVIHCMNLLLLKASVPSWDGGNFCGACCGACEVPAPASSLMAGSALMLPPVVMMVLPWPCVVALCLRNGLASTFSFVLRLSSHTGLPCFMHRFCRTAFAVQPGSMHLPFPPCLKHIETPPVRAFVLQPLNAHFDFAPCFTQL